MPKAPIRPATASSNGSATRRPSSALGPARAAVARRRRVPWVVAGVALVVGFALAFATVSARLGGGRGVLALKRSLPAGHVLGAGDLRSVSVPVSAGLATLPATQAASVLGRPLAVPVVAGSLLGPGEVGAGSSLPVGQAVVGLAVKAGQYPPALASGDRVDVVDTPGPSATSQGTSTGTTSGAAVGATVVGVELAPTGSSAAAVLSLQVARSDAATVAGEGAAGQASVVLLGASGGS